MICESRGDVRVQLQRFLTFKEMKWNLKVFTHIQDQLQNTVTGWSRHSKWFLPGYSTHSKNKFEKKEIMLQWNWLQIIQRNRSEKNNTISIVFQDAAILEFKTACPQITDNRINWRKIVWDYESFFWGSMLKDILSVCNNRRESWKKIGQDLFVITVELLVWHSK